MQKSVLPRELQHCRNSRWTAVVCRSSLCYVLAVLPRSIPILLCLGLFLLCSAQAQQRKQTAHITIQVDDVSGAVTPTAHVEILGANFAKNLETDSFGKLSVDLPIGSYDLTAIQLGFKAAKKRVDVQDTKDQLVTFVLELAPSGPVGMVTGGRIGEPTYASLPDTLQDTRGNSHLPAGSTYTPLPLPEKPSCASLPDELQDESNVHYKFCSPCAGVEQQRKATAHIAIEVHDPTGAPIPKAHVEISVSGKDVKKLDADDNGKLSIDLPTGTYELTATFPAFTAAKKRIEVQDNTSQTVMFMLNVVIFGPTVEVLDVPRVSEPMPMPSKDPEKLSYEVTITTSQTATLGSEVKLHIITKNISSETIYRVVRSGGPPGRNLDIAVRDSKGNLEEETEQGRKIHGTDQNREPWSGSVFTGRYPLRPGEVIEENFNLSEEYNFSKPGRYSVQVLRSDIVTEEEIKSHLSPQAVKSNTTTTLVR